MSESNHPVIPWAVVVSVVLFLVAQTIGAVWWAASLSATVSNNGLALAAFTETLSEQNGQQDAENLRQWTRINGSEIVIADLISDYRTSEVLMTEMRKDIEEIKHDTSATNELLREFIREAFNERNEE